MLKWVTGVPAETFVAAWNGATSLDEAAGRVKELAGGPAPRWAVLVRAKELRAAGLPLKPLAGEPARGRTS